ncbi:hypothetical protein AAVH_22049 [Aphelenchoides avenae]|nr:hypothetical protein AAVH_22049 [Aphelenchus avenae]
MVPASWQEYRENRFKVHVVKKVITDTAVLYTCSCQEGSRKRLCKHALHVMCDPSVGMYTYPDEATAMPLEPNRKRGRPKKIATQNRYAVN